MESSMKIVALGNRAQRLGKYGRGVDPCAKIGRPVHGSVSHGIVIVVSSSAVISASALTVTGDFQL